MRISSAAALTLAAVLALSLGVGIAPAAAAPRPVFTEADLEDALHDGDEAVLQNNITFTYLNYGLTASPVLDLNGFTLTSRNITIGFPYTLTVVDSSVGMTGEWVATAPAGYGVAGITVQGVLLIGSLKPGGTVRATGSCNGSQVCGAGIGGDAFEGSGTIHLNSGNVFAYGGGTGPSETGGSGIGAGYGGASGAVTVQSATVTAVGGPYSPGIGGASGANLTMAGGSVTATGGQDAAGIGGGLDGPGGTIDINGGAVTATGGSHGAGIGGGGGFNGGAGGTITIDGATVSATGTDGGADIGGGLGVGGGVGGDYPNYGGSLTTGAGSLVTVSSIRTVGWDNGHNAIVGSLSVGGDLEIRSGGNLDVETPASADVTATGRIFGPGSVSGSGTIDNLGAIQNTTVTTSVTTNNYLVTFEGNRVDAVPTVQTVRVYAGTFTLGDRALGVSPTSGSGAFAEWNTASSGAGTAFTLTTPLTADVSVYAQYGVPYIVITPSTATRTAGQSATFTAEKFSSSGASQGDVTAATTFTTSNGAGDTVTLNSIQFKPAGTTTVTGALTADPTISDATDITVSADTANPVSIQLALSGTSVAQGGSLTYSVTGADAWSNTFDVTNQVTATSSVPTDVISGTTISFPTASPHTITAALGALRSSLTIQVIPGLAATGFALPAILPAYALLTALIGAAFVLAARRRHPGAARR